MRGQEVKTLDGHLMAKKLGQNIHDGKISMIKNETKSDPSFLQHEKEKLTILNLQRYELIEL